MEFQFRFFNKVFFVLPAMAMIAGHVYGQFNETILKGHESIISKTAISPSGKWGASAEHSSTEIFLWHLPQGKLVKKLQGPKGRRLRCFAFTGDDKVITAAYNTSLIQWTLNELGEFKENDFLQLIYALAYSSDGSKLALAFEKSVEILDAKTMECEHVFETEFKQDEHAIGRLAFSSDSKWIAGAGATDARIRLWKIGGGKRPVMIKGPKFYVSGLAIGNMDTALISTDLCGRFLAWNFETKKIIRKRIEADESPIFAMSYCEKKKVLAYATQEGDIRLWDIEHLRLARSLNFGFAVNSIAISPEGDFLLVGYGNEFKNTDHEANQGKLAVVNLIGKRRN
jgi:WD40 repeat protein